VGLSLVLGTLAVTLLYLMLNAVFLIAAPAADLRGVLNVGSIAATHLLGSSGGRIMSGIIATGLLASISALVWAGPRVMQRVGEDYRRLGVLGRTTSGGIPNRALGLQLLAVLTLITLGSFESLLVFAEIPLLLCLILGVTGLLIERNKDKGSMGKGGEGGFQCPLYPLPPLVFILCAGSGLLYSAICKPWIALAGVAITLLPLTLYGWISRQKTP
jgi:APA family basic amino acid/polyamine antiporter